MIMQKEFLTEFCVKCATQKHLTVNEYSISDPSGKYSKVALALCPKCEKKYSYAEIIDGFGIMPEMYSLPELKQKVDALEAQVAILMNERNSK